MLTFIDGLIGFFLQAGVLGLFIFVLVTVLLKVGKEVGDELKEETQKRRE